MEPETPITLATEAELNTFLDTTCSYLVDNRDLKARLKTAQISPELTGFVELEQVALDFWFDGCVAKREFSAITNTGEEVGSPLPSELKPGALDYFVQRFEQSTNPYLKARYGLLLWNAPSPYKRLQYLQGSLDSCLEALSKTVCNGYGLNNCLDLLCHAYAVATTVSYRKADVITSIRDRFTNKISFERKGRNQLLNLITKQAKLFRPDALEILAAARDLYEENNTEEDFYASQQVAKLTARFAQGNNLGVQEWHYLKGKAYESTAQKRQSDESSLMPIQFYTRAAQAYKLAGNEAAEQQALQKAQDLKNNLRLATVTIKLPDEYNQMLQEDIKQRTEHLLNFDSASIFSFLGSSEDIIPDYTALLEQVPKFGFSISDIASVIAIDVNKNLQQTGSDTIDGVPTEKLRDSYSFMLSVRLNYLFPLFIEGCRTGKLSFTALSDYLDQNSWIAQPLSGTDLDGNTFEYTWQPLLYPALEEFFKQLELATQEAPVTLPSFVLCLDSLTLKIEGLLRELLQRTGGATLATHKRGDLREVYFDDLIKMALENQLMTDSEYFFFRFLFTPLGQNHRNNIAHSYYRLPKFYSLGSMILVFCAFLRITHFQLFAKPAPTESN